MNNSESSPPVDIKTAVEQILGALKEGFEGPAPNWGYFTDRGPDAGLFALLAAMSADQASRVTGGTTIAGHIHHLAFSLDAGSAFIKGEKTPRRWEESWSVRTVDDTAWKALRERLLDKYEIAKKTIEGHATDGVTSLGIAVGVVAHVAYHLGAVRQKMAFGRA